MVARRLLFTWYMQGRGKALILPHLQRNIYAQRLSPRALTGKSQSVKAAFWGHTMPTSQAPVQDRTGCVPG